MRLKNSFVESFSVFGSLNFEKSSLAAILIAISWSAPSDLSYES